MKQTTTTLSYTLAPNGTAQIPIRFGDSGSCIAAVDTGSLNNAISDAVVKRLGLSLEPLKDSSGAPIVEDGKPDSLVRVPRTVIGTLALRNQEYIVLPAARLDDVTRHHAQVILGLNTLRHFAIVFDFAQGTLSFCFPGNLTTMDLQAEEMSNAYTVPLKSSEDTDEMYEVEVEIQNGKKSIRRNLCLDSGSPDTILPEDARKALGLAPIFGTQTGDMVNGKVTLGETRITSLKLGNFQIFGPEVRYTISSDYSDTVFGISPQSLPGRSVIVDFPASKMYISVTYTSVPTGDAPPRPTLEPGNSPPVLAPATAPGTPP